MLPIRSHNILWLAVSSIYRDDRPLEDLYRRRPFARRLYQRLVALPRGSSLCVALTGPWGNGKTTTLRYLKEEQDQNEPLTVTSFDPLIYHNPDDLVVSFYNRIVAAVGKKDRDAAKQLAKALKGLATIARGAGVAADIFVPGVGSTILAFAGIGKEAGETSNEFARAPRSAESLLLSARSIMERSKVRVLVLIDEVDRLTPQEIQALFRLIRMVADFPNVIYVAAFDRQMVVDALAALFGASSDARTAASRYLEKIFQLEIPLPFPDRSLIRRELLRELDGIRSAVITKLKLRSSA